MEFRQRNIRSKAALKEDRTTQGEKQWNHLNPHAIKKRAHPCFYEFVFSLELSPAVKSLSE